MANSTGGSIVWDLSVESRKFDAGLKSAKNKAKEFGDGLESAFKSATKHLDGWSQSAAQSINRYSKLLAGATIASATFAIKSAADMQTAAQSFEILVGNAQVGQKLFGQIADFAAKTPFEFPELAQSAKTLLGYGVASDKVLDRLGRLSDAAGATGGELRGISLAYAQMIGRGKVTGDNLRQLTENMVTLRGELSKVSGVSMPDLDKAIENGEISVEELNAALDLATNQGGKFFKGTDKLAQTFNGRMSTLKDTVAEFGRNLVGVKIDPELGLVIKPGGIFDRLSNSLPDLVKKLEAATPRIVEFFDTFLKKTEDFIRRFVENVKNQGFATAVGDALTEMLGKINWAGFTLAAVSLLVAIAPDIVWGFVQGIYQAVRNNPLDFILLFGLLGFVPGLGVVLGTVLGGIPIIGPIASFIIKGFTGAASVALSPILNLFKSIALQAVTAVGSRFAALAATIGTPVVMPAIVITAALAAIAAVQYAHWQLQKEVEKGLNSLKNNMSSYESSLRAALGAGRIDQAEYDRRLRAFKGSQLQTTRSLADLAGRASGGPVSASHPYIVGEKGPELFMPRSNGKIIPNEQLTSSMKNEYHIGTINISSDVDGERWLKKLTRDQEIFDNGIIPSRAGA